jgi:uncharacterized protein YqjF (DUF2071 family)
MGSARDCCIGRTRPEVVQRVLPPPLAVDVFEDHAWVGLVAFPMRIRPPWSPFLPWLSTFPETNARTYVVGPDGRREIWFLSLDVPRLGAVIAGRATYRSPYHWARMRMAQDGELLRYGSHRPWPGPRGVGLCAPSGVGIAYAPVEHGRWPLRRAEAVRVSDSFVPAARLPRPEGEPHMLCSPGVEVRIGGLHRIV